MNQNFLGVDIGGSKCAVILGEKRGKILKKESFLTKSKPKECIREIIEIGRKFLKGATNVKSVGVSCGSPLDPYLGIIQSPANLPNWVDVPIVDILKDAWGLEVGLDNDANAGALAELYFGAGRGCQNMVFMTFGTGLGSGLILNGQVVRGQNGYAGEIGHFRLAPNGPVGCRKKGSFEGFCSGGGIAQLAETMRMDFTEGTSLVKNASAKDVGDAAKKGDILAQNILAKSGEYLGRGLALVVDILNPEKILIGSIFLRCEEFIRPSMERTLQEEALAQPLSVCEVSATGLGEAIGDFAALSVAIECWEAQNKVSRS